MGQMISGMMNKPLAHRRTHGWRVCVNRVRELCINRFSSFVMSDG
jgi:hypothetical protein